MDNKDTKETLKVQKTRLVLLADGHYYNYVFKKTEKIVCAVFYILHNHKDTNGHTTAQHVLNITDTAHRALNAIVRTLSHEPHEAGLLLVRGVTHLVRLQSYLKLGHATGIFSRDVVEVLDSEIEGVIRSIGRYLDDNTAGSFDLSDAEPATALSRAFTATGTSRASTGVSRATPTRPRDTQSHQSRQDQIRDIIAVKKSVSIKDISADIKDCSEKTIQRELNDMIEKAIIKREGERRWSRYSLI